MGYKMRCLGIDIGGTFTDLILIDSENENISLHKVSSTPGNQSIGVRNGLNLFQEINDLDLLVHGTTVATNAILEGKGARTALITTKGFEDIIEIGRQNRTNLYSFFPERVEPIINQQSRFGISERVNAKGEIILPLENAELEEIVNTIKTAKYQSVAVSLLFSFFNPKHELLISDFIKSRIPEINISRSSWVLPVFREYDRSSVTVLDAYIAPNYFSEFALQVKKKGIIVPPLILLSTGGVTQIKNAAERSVETVLSGLAGGVLGGHYSAQTLDIKNILTLDVGGTSTDVASIVNGEIEITTENMISGHPIPIPTIAVQTIGAGGGSIAKEKHGIFQVGPESAGADPGPACYEKGGIKPTVTDANLVRGFLNPEFFCGGTIKINKKRSREVIGKFAKKTEFDSTESCAEGIIEVFENNIALALRKVSTEKGYDSRHFALCCFGGGGPLHCCSLAERLSIKKVIIPPFPGVWSAFGLLTANIRHDLSKSILRPLKDAEMPFVKKIIHELGEEGVVMCIEDGFQKSDVIIIKNVDIRLKGQSYEITVPFSEDLSILSESFDEAHLRAYGYSSPSSPREVVNVRVSCYVPLPKFSMTVLPVGDISPPDNSMKGTRNVFLKDRWIKMDIYQKDLLLAGNLISGPAIIEQSDSTIFIDINWNAKVTPDGHMIITKIVSER
jgi:N-methylhydantoinase A